MRARNALVLIALCLCAAARADVGRAASQRAFDAFARNCAGDIGALRCVSLCGGTVIADPGTGDAVANDGWNGKLRGREVAMSRAWS